MLDEEFIIHTVHQLLEWSYQGIWDEWGHSWEH